MSNQSYDPNDPLEGFVHTNHDYREPPLIDWKKVAIIFTIVSFLSTWYMIYQRSSQAQKSFDEVNQILQDAQNGED